MGEPVLVPLWLRQEDQYQYSYWCCLHDTGNGIVSLTGTIMGTFGTPVLILVVMVLTGAPVLVLVPL